MTTEVEIPETDKPAEPQTAKLIKNKETSKWEVWLKEKVIARSNSREYAISAVLDGTNKKIRKQNVTKLLDEDNVEINYIDMIRQSSIVKNTDRYAALIQESIENRTEISGPLAAEMKLLRNTFAHLYCVRPEDFTFLKDMWYYTGGWPKAESPPRVEFVFREMHNIMRFYSYFNRTDELKDYFKRFGLTVTIHKSHIEGLNQKMESWVHEEWFKCFGKLPMPKDKREVGLKIMDRAMDVQREICRRADAIKIHAAKKAESICGVKPESFISVVNSAVRIKKSGMKSSSALYKEKMKHVISEAALNEALDKSS